MGVNTLFNQVDYEVLPKLREIFDRYCKIILWGRANPILFVSEFIGLELTDYQKWLFLGMWRARNAIILMSRNGGKSFLTAPYLAARSLLFPNNKSYIISNSAAQSADTLSKLESLATGNLGTAVGLSSVFIENCMRANPKAPAFTHGKDGGHVALFNGSEVTSLPATPDTIRGKRSNTTIWDEAAFIPKDVFDAGLPFASQSKDFMTGKGLDLDIMPKQLPNLNILLSSASDIYSEMYQQYRTGFKEMLLGNPEWFVADMNCDITTHPYLNGKPMPPLVAPEIIEAAQKTDIYRYEREYLNLWSSESGPDSLITRSAIDKLSKPYYPEFVSSIGKKYVIAFDPAAKIDSAVIAVGELFRDESKGLMMRLVNCKNLLEVLNNGEKMVVQRPEQIEILKGMILDYNDGSYEYNGIDLIIIDSGGGGYEVSLFLLTEWKGKDGKIHNGFIDLEDDYMKLRADDYPGNAEKLKLFNFKKDKTNGYEHCQSMLNLGLFIMPKSLNARNEMEFEEYDDEGGLNIRYEKPNHDLLDALLLVGICKTELLNMEKIKKPNGTVVFDLSSLAKSKNCHDDHADVIMMLCHRLFELRAAEVLDKEAVNSDFSEMFSGNVQHSKKTNSRFNDGRRNPFTTGGKFRF